MCCIKPYNEIRLETSGWYENSSIRRDFNLTVEYFFYFYAIKSFGILTPMWCHRHQRGWWRNNYEWLCWTGPWLRIKPEEIGLKGSYSGSLMTADCRREEKGFQIWSQPHDWLDEIVAISEWPFKMPTISWLIRRNIYREIDLWVIEYFKFQIYIARYHNKQLSKGAAQKSKSKKKHKIQLVPHRASMSNSGEEKLPGVRNLRQNWALCGRPLPGTVYEKVFLNYTSYLYWAASCCSWIPLILPSSSKHEREPVAAFTCHKNSRGV